jgi:hypothetical protein
VFSANLQETLGISCYEGALVGAIPMVPDRLSYTEMYKDQFKYPSLWTESWGDYIQNRHLLVETIVGYIENYKTTIPFVQKQAEQLTKRFFHSKMLLSKLTD